MGHPNWLYFVETGVPFCTYRAEGTFNTFVNAYKQALEIPALNPASLGGQIAGSLGICPPSASQRIKPYRIFSGLVPDSSSCNVSLSFIGATNCQGQLVNYNVHGFLWNPAGFEMKVFQQLTFTSIVPGRPDPANIALPSTAPFDCTQPNLTPYCSVFYPAGAPIRYDL